MVPFPAATGAPCPVRWRGPTRASGRRLSRPPDTALWQEVRARQPPPPGGAKWRERNILDDPVKESNRKGAVTFAMGGPNTRSTQIFVNTVDNAQLDGMGFAPIGRVTEGIDVVEKLYNGYGEGAPRGFGPEQGLIARDGNSYLNRFFPLLDSIISARIIP